MLQDYVKALLAHVNDCWYLLLYNLILPMFQRETKFYNIVRIAYSRVPYLTVITRFLRYL